LVTPYAPGGSGDIGARIYSDEMAKILNVPITVVNRPGGSGVHGTIYVIKAKKDGYILLNGGSGAMVFVPIISKEATFDPLRDLVPLAHFSSVPSVFDVRSDSPFKTLNELIDYARKNPDKLKNATGGPSNPSYFNFKILCVKNNIKIPTVPFDSGGEALPALLGGHVDMSCQTITTEAPHIKAGKVRGLAITSKKRHPDFPNIPTTAELGYPYVNFQVWFGVFAATGVPQPVLNVLIPALERVFKNPEVIDKANRVNMPIEYMGPEEFRKFFESEINIVRKIAQDANLIKK